MCIHLCVCVYLPISQSGSVSIWPVFSAITNHIQASQCATSEKQSIKSVRIMAAYWEYRSIFCNSRANRSKRVIFTKWICDSCEWGERHRQEKNRKKRIEITNHFNWQVMGLRNFASVNLCQVYQRRINCDNISLLTMDEERQRKIKIAGTKRGEH